MFPNKCEHAYDRLRQCRADKLVYVTFKPQTPVARFSCTGYGDNPIKGY